MIYVGHPFLLLSPLYSHCRLIVPFFQVLSTTGLQADATAVSEEYTREMIARGIYKGIVRSLSGSVVIVPLPVSGLRAINMGGNIIELCWTQTADSLDSNAVATGFKIYQSTDGYDFDDGTIVFGTTLSCYNITGLVTGATYFFKVAAFNTGGESLVKHLVGAKVIPTLLSAAQVLIVDGFDRGFVYNSTNVYQRFTHNYIIQHGLALSAAGVQFDSIHHSVLSQVSSFLNSYALVIWNAGTEASTIASIPSNEQMAIS